MVAVHAFIHSFIYCSMDHPFHGRGVITAIAILFVVARDASITDRFFSEEVESSPKIVVIFSGRILNLSGYALVIAR